MRGFKVNVMARCGVGIFFPPPSEKAEAGRSESNT